MAGKKLHNARNGKPGVGGAVDGMLKHWLLVNCYWLLGTETWRTGQAKKGTCCESDWGWMSPTNQLAEEVKPAPEAARLRG